MDSLPDILEALLTGANELPITSLSISIGENPSITFITSDDDNHRELHGAFLKAGAREASPPQEIRGKSSSWLSSTLQLPKYGGLYVFMYGPDKLDKPDEVASMPTPTPIEEAF